MFIYLITNKINGKRYVGQTTKDISKRIAGHINSKFPIGRALRKYGLQSFDVSVIDNAETLEVLNEKEKFWISYYNSIRPNGYNILRGGGGALGLTHTAEAKARIGQANKNNQYAKGHKLSEEHKQKISAAQKGHRGWNKGKHHTIEARNKISVSVRKILALPEVRSKLIKSHTRKQKDENG